MSDELPTDLRPVVEFFGLPNAAIVEKDFYVVRALAAIAAIDAAPMRLVFGGGTALARAHRLVQRMSEDIDFKIVAEVEPKRAALSRLKEKVTQSLLAAGFAFDPENPAHRESGNKNRYTIFQLPYQSSATGEGALRPEIQIEIAVWPLRRPAVDLPVRSFVAEALGRPAEVARIACVSVTQTAAEKFVALTRRTAAEIANAGGPRDPTLVRHLYDLHVLRAHYDAAEVAGMVRAIMDQDAVVFGKQFPGYREDPMRETMSAIEALGSRGEYAERYEAFRRVMVYGEPVTYEICLETLNTLIRRLS